MPKGVKGFVKGQSGNPEGARRHNKELKAVRRLSQDAVADIGSLVLEGDITRLQEIIDDPTTQVLKLWLAKVAMKGVVKANPIYLNAILDRVIGKPKDTQRDLKQLQGELMQLSDEQFVELIQSKIQSLDQRQETVEVREVIQLEEKK